MHGYALMHNLIMKTINKFDTYMVIYKHLS